MPLDATRETYWDSAFLFEISAPIFSISYILYSDRDLLKGNECVLQDWESLTPPSLILNKYLEGRVGGF